MRVESRLPERFQHHSTFDLQDSRKLAIIANGLALLLLIVSFVLYGDISVRLNPDRDWASIVNTATRVPHILALCIVLTIVFHELLHGLGFWAFTLSRPVFGLNWRSAYAGAPGWYLGRLGYAAVTAAPLLVLTFVGIVLVGISGDRWAGSLLLATAFNTASAAGDLMVLGWLLRHPQGVLIEDTGRVMHAYVPMP